MPRACGAAVGKAVTQEGSYAVKKELFYQEVIRLCRALIQAESLSGSEGKAVKVLEDAFHTMGYDSVEHDRYGNVIGCIRGKFPGPKLLLDGHIDTVPVETPEQWKHAPFAAELTGDRIYGRGASDMKGALAGMACAAAQFAQDCRRAFPGTIYVAGVVFEECYEGVAAREISGAVQPDYVVIGEASRRNLKIGQRGRAELVLETYGKPAHSANPEQGVNAVTQMMKLLARLEQYDPPEQPGLGKAIMELTDICSAPYPSPSVVPERCTATFDRRLLVGERRSDVLTPIRSVIDQLSREDSRFHASCGFRSETKRCYTGCEIQAERFFPAWSYDREEGFVQAAYRALCTLGRKPDITTYSFCTNGSHYAGERGIKTLGYGPSQESLAHTVDEYILLEELLGAADGYVKLIEALLSLPQAASPVPAG